MACSTYSRWHSINTYTELYRATDNSIDSLRMLGQGRDNYSTIMFVRAEFKTLIKKNKDKRPLNMINHNLLIKKIITL